jgi:hypothetical protein
LELTLKEEQKLETRKGYRTAASTLRKLAASPMIFELDEKRRGDWDSFQVRKIGFKAQQDKDVLSMISKLTQAKLGPEEVTYLRRMQKDEKLRSAIIKLGS